MTMTRNVWIAALLAGSMMFAPAAQAQEDGESKAAVKVNGHVITAAEVKLAADDILPHLTDVPPKLRYPFIVEYLVERHLLAQLAVSEGVNQTKEYKDRLAFYQAKALRDAYFAAKLKPMITDEEIKKAYDAQAAKITPEKRARARHILLGTEQEANEIITRLGSGDSFEDLAKKYSVDGSKEFGGDLGYFSAAEMVPEFSKAVFAMKPGDVSGPVKTDFGWHIIKLEDIKEQGAQPLEEVKPAIRQVLLRQAVQDKIAELRKNGKIEILDPDLVKLQEETEKQRQKIIEQQQQQQQQQTGSGGKSDKQN
jgi:peptidyl-prolyl cis-trans isomerase C